jgi:hypothetical protein
VLSGPLILMLGAGETGRIRIGRIEKVSVDVVGVCCTSQSRSYPDLLMRYDLDL